MSTLVLTGGGTAGHCTPNLALLPYLKKYFDRIIYIGSKKGIEQNLAKSAELPYYPITCQKLNRAKKITNISLPFNVLKGIVEAGKILDKEKPNAVFSKGGYVALPVIIAAKSRNIPIISHESDYTIGLANKITAKFSKKVLTSFSDTAKTIKNGEYVGAPLKDSLFTTEKKEALKLFGFSGTKPILLVTGGSQGAQAINNVIRNSLSDILPKFDVLHICGKNNLLQEKAPQGYFQAEFVNDIEKAFCIASVCVSRAGSNTLFELMSLKKPCVLIPLPKGASRGDQILNAQYFQKLGLAHVLEQNALTAKSLTFAINAVYSNRHNIARNFQLNPIDNACERISKIIVEYSS